MLDCKYMNHRGIQLKKSQKENHRLLVETLRDSEAESRTGRLELIPYTDSIVRVRYTERDSFAERESYSLLPPPADRPRWQTESTPNALILKTDRLRIEVAKDTCALTWKDRVGRLLVREPEEGGKILQAIDVEKMVYDENKQVINVDSVDGMTSTVSEGRLVKDREGYSTALRLAFEEDEALYGLGQHEEGIFNYRRETQYLYQTNMKVALPTLVSSKGYAIHCDTHAFSTFRGLEEYGEFWTETADQLDFFFVYGPDFDHIVAGLRQLTGDLPMHPLWAYGFVQSKERYETSEELINTVESFREKQVPLDGIVLDWHSWKGELWGQKSFDPVRFPDPSALTEKLHSLNARLMISIWPNMRQGGENQREMLNKGCLLADDQTCDSFSKEARALYWKQAHEGLYRHGVDAWWCDSTEPYNAEWDGSVKPQPWQRINLNLNEMKKYIDPAEINAYCLLHSRGMFEGQRSADDCKRVVNLTRSAGPSQQRYGTITWSGDIEARWSRLRKQLADGLNFTVTGNPRWTFDIGAFFVKPGVKWFWDGQYPDGNKDLGYRELYTRWFQTGAFLPMFRSHGTDTAREIWNFGEPGDRFYDTIKYFTELRYRLLPYIYSLAAKEVFGGYTMFRSLLFDFREDREVRNISDQFMFGPSLMVCPVTEPMYYERNSRELEDRPKTRKVYLPKGREWYDFWTNEKYAGGQWIEADAPLEKIPLFVPAGSLIPLGPVVQHTGDSRNRDCTVRVYPGRDVNFDIYEDSGDGYGYEKGEYAWTKLSWNEETSVFTTGERQGSYLGMKGPRQFTPEIIG